MGKTGPVLDGTDLATVEEGAKGMRALHRADESAVGRSQSPCRRATSGRGTEA